MPERARNLPAGPRIVIWSVFCLFLLQCSHAPSPTEPTQAPPRVAQLAGVPLSSLTANLELCQFTLAQSGVEFTPAPDRPVRAGCGYLGAVEVDALGTSINRPFVATCPVAAALTALTKQVIQPAARKHFDQEVRIINHWGTYACRNRNSRQGGARSEHARANAVDISAFQLSDGRWIKVKEHWGQGGSKSAFLRDVHQGACRYFNGVIGPDGDRFHRDHFHFDMGPWRFCE